MYGEPSVWEYGRMLQEANERISTNGFICHHINTGWLGYYIKAPNGKEYQLVKRSMFGNDVYYLCKYSPYFGSHGTSLGLVFADLDEAKQAILQM